MPDTQQTPIEEVQAGAVLDGPVFEQGRTLFAPGRILSRQDILELKRLRIAAVRLRDAESALGDVVQSDSLSPELREQAVNTVQLVYEDFQHFDHRHANQIQSLSLQINDEVRRATKLGIAVHDLRSYSDYTYRHSVNVTAISLAIGIRMGLSTEQLNTLTVGGLLHDLGKMRIPKEILEKEGELSPEEVKVVRRHPEWGWDILKERWEFSPVVWSIARQHHETMDGRGYPDGLMGWDIHELSRIVTVVDMWDALRSMRPYKPAWNPDQVLTFLDSPQMTAKLDPNVLEIFNSLIVPYPIGSHIMITGGRTAHVVGLHLEDYSRPIVHLDTGGMGAYLDLFENKGISIISTLELAI